MTMYTDLDDPTADDAPTITAIHNEFARVHYTRPLPVARKASRPMMLIAGGMAAASIAVVAVVAVAPADGPAFGWTAEARTATADENATALKLCDMVRTQEGNSTSFRDNVTGTPNMTLHELDLRGDFAVATLYDDAFAKVCIINTSSALWTAGENWLVLDRASDGELSASANTDVLPGATIVFGWVPGGVDSVQIDVPDTPAFTVPAANGMFATWVPITLERGSGTVTGINPNAAPVATASIGQPEIPE
jgi:hypothetical protein